jgi:hypothetical protein
MVADHPWTGCLTCDRSCAPAGSRTCDGSDTRDGSKTCDRYLEMSKEDRI